MSSSAAPQSQQPTGISSSAAPQSQQLAGMSSSAAPQSQQPTGMSSSGGPQPMQPASMVSLAGPQRSGTIASDVRNDARSATATHYEPKETGVYSQPTLEEHQVQRATFISQDDSTIKYSVSSNNSFTSSAQESQEIDPPPPPKDTNRKVRIEISENLNESTAISSGIRTSNIDSINNSTTSLILYEDRQSSPTKRQLRIVPKQPEVSTAPEATNTLLMYFLRNNNLPNKLNVSSTSTSNSTSVVNLNNDIEEVPSVHSKDEWIRDKDWNWEYDPMKLQQSLNMKLTKYV